MTSNSNDRHDQMGEQARATSAAIRAALEGLSNPGLQSVMAQLQQQARDLAEAISNIGAAQHVAAFRQFADDQQQYMRRSQELAREALASSLTVNTTAIREAMKHTLRTLNDQQLEATRALFRSSALQAGLQAAKTKAQSEREMLEEVARESPSTATQVPAIEELARAYNRSRSLFTLPGSVAFRLYDTFGFPYELTEEIALEHGLMVDRAGFDVEMTAQRERARAARRNAGHEAGGFDYRELPLPASRFMGYESVVAIGVVQSLVLRQAQDERVVASEEASEGDAVEVVLDQTPFYPEGGGQVGDQGSLDGPNSRVRITDSFKAGNGLIVHRGVVEHGVLAVNDQVAAEVDAERRADIARNHTATHLLHAALRQVLGNHVGQAGSMVAADRLRFDFSHIAAMTPDEVTAVQSLVNQRVREDWDVHHHVSSYQQAIESGALAFFDEKYGETVRVIEVSRPDREVPHTQAIPADLKVFSKELCGGTHLGSTGEIGFFKIVAESSVAAGVRRIEAVTGRGFEQWEASVDREARAIAQDMNTSLLRVATHQDSLSERVGRLLAQNQELQRKLQAVERDVARQQLSDVTSGVVDIDGVTLLSMRVEAQNVTALRELTDALRDKLPDGVIVLGAALESGAAFVAVVPKPLTERGLHAGNLVKDVAGVAGGKGGGRPDLGQAGAPDAAKLDEALQAAAAIVRKQLGG